MKPLSLSIKYRKIKIAAYSTTFLLFIILLVFLLNIPTLTYFISSYLLPALAIACAVFAFVTAKNLVNQKQGKRTIELLAWGFTLWAIAEVIWLVFLLVDLDPYPSIADLFWAAGYIPFFLALQVNNRYLGADLDDWQKSLIVSTLFVLGGLTSIFIILPILQDFAFDRIVEVIVDLLYPILDLILIYLALREYMVSRKSRYSTAWLFIALGLVLTALADLAFGYTSWYEIYSAEHTNLISKIIDWGYIACYPLFALGIYSYRLGSELNQDLLNTLSSDTKLEGNIANTSYLIYTNSVDKVISVSQNLAQIKEMENIHLQDLLIWLCGSNQEHGQIIFQQLKEQIVTHHLVKDLPVELRAFGNAQEQGWLSGMLILTSEGMPSGMNLVLRTYRPGLMPNEGLSNHNIGVAHHTLRSCGAAEFPFIDCWIAYANQYIFMLFELLESHSGELTARQMITQMEDSIKHGNINIQINSNQFEVAGDAGYAEVHQALLLLLRQAEGYAQDILGKEKLLQEYLNLEHKMNPTVLSVAKDYGLCTLFLREAPI